MLKYVLLVAFAANVIFLAVEADSSSKSKNTASSSSSSSSRASSSSGSQPNSSSSSSSHSSSNSNSNDDEDNENCQSKKKCKKHETYETCVNPCRVHDCSAVGFPRNCPVNTGDGPSCLPKPACVCDDGYYRNDKGICIPSKDCPSCGGDPNARPGCGNCGKTCANYNQTEPIFCTAICYDNACDCLPNYVRDNNTGKCVLPENCTPKCGKDEIYTSCVNGGCDKRNCSQLSQPKLCIDPIKCVGGCICRKDYLRDENGICVPIEQCKKKCTKSNEVYEICPAKCPFRTCGIDDRLIDCAPSPQPGDPDCPPPACRCKNGFFRDDKGNCVRWENCPQCNKPNEEYDPCPVLCPPQECGVDPSVILCIVPPKLGDPNCKPGCRCSDGFVKNDKNVCIPKNECPNKKCKLHERYETCVNPCKPQKCSEVGFPRECPVNSNGTAACLPKPACVCEDGYYRNCKGICIPSDECSSCGGDPNARPGCGNCRKTCAVLEPEACIQVCYENACDCLPSYLLDDTGKCVLPKDCKETCVTVAPSTNSCNNTDDQLKNFELGNTGFTGKFFYEVAKSKPGESIIMSAFSVLPLLAQLALYTSGASLKELLKTFNLQDKDQIRCVFPKLIDLLEADQNNTLDLGAKVFVNQEYPLTDSFKQDSKNVFDAEAENINVNDPDQAAATINDWAAEITRNQIKGLISPDAITSLTRLILANAIYFKGTWKTQFDPKNTKDQDFHVNKDDVIQVKTMKVKDKFNYAESTDLDAKIVELPYVGEDIRFIGILPNDIEGLDSLLEKLQDEYAFNKAINSLSQQTVTVSLPTMDISSTIDLVEILQKTGVTKIFDAGTSNLSGIIKSNEPLYVSDGTQKATILVNEEGSEAAAANVIGVSTTSAVLNPPPEYVFNVDHPVAYYILYKDIPLFCGTFVKL